MRKKLLKRGMAVVLALMVLLMGFTVSAEESNAAMTLEQWTMSEECSEVVSAINEDFTELGLIMEMKADGNTLYFIYHYVPEVWGEINSELMAMVFEAFDMESLFTELLGGMVAGLQPEFATEYGILLDGVCFIYVAPDGVPFASIVMPVGNV